MGKMRPKSGVWSHFLENEVSGVKAFALTGRQSCVRNTQGGALG